MFYTGAFDFRTRNNIDKKLLTCKSLEKKTEDTDNCAFEYLVYDIYQLFLQNNNKIN